MQANLSSKHDIGRMNWKQFVNVNVKLNETI